jgi:hypothetical protein
VRLAALVAGRMPDDAEAAGLHALLLLDARFAARVDAAGALVPLEEQDRSRGGRTSSAPFASLGTNWSEILTAGTLAANQAKVLSTEKRSDLGNRRESGDGLVKQVVERVGVFHHREVSDP